MIITISGAACTGKTTLLKAIEEYLRSDRGHSHKRIRFYGEFIRNQFNKHYSHKYKDFADLLAGDPEDIIDIHKETARLFNEVLWTSDPKDILIFDRSPLDISIYMYMNLIPYLREGRGDIVYKYREASKYVYRCSADFMNHDPIIFYTKPFSDSVEEDGFRPTSLINRRELELALFDKEFMSLPTVYILPSNISERLCTVKSVLVDNVK